MKYYIESTTEQIYAYEDDCPSIYIKEGLTSLTDEEYQRKVAELNAINIEAQEQAQEFLKAQKLTEFYEIATELGLI